MVGLLRCSEELLKRYLESKRREYRRLNWQVRVWQKIVKHSESGGWLGLLEAPTAAGKTEAAVMPYLSQYLVGEWLIAPSMIYVLPNKTLIRQQFKRLRNLSDVVEKESEAHGRHVRIYVHEDIGGVTHNKSFLIGDIVIATLDCFLYGYLGVRTLADRVTFPAGFVSTSYLVFDEVHLCQDEYYYTPHVLRLIFRQLKELNIPVLIASATIPPQLRNFMFDRVAIDWQERVEEARRGAVTVEYKGEASLTQQVKNLVLKGDIPPTDDGKALIVANTVERAVNVFKFLRSKLPTFKNQIELIHARLVEHTRVGRENRLTQRDCTEACIAVTTQVAESGLDIDNLRLVVTEEAPLDALIQRLGRCARREGETGVAYVVGAPEDAPYSRYLMSNARRVLSEKDHEIERALMKLTKAQFVIAECYRDWSPAPRRPELGKHLKRLTEYVESWLGIARTVPKQLRAKPELYISLVPLGDVRPGDRIEAKKTAGRTFNINWRGREVKNYRFLAMADRGKVLELRWNREEFMYQAIGVNEVRPLSIYVLDASHYERCDDYELGLVRLK